MGSISLTVRQGHSLLRYLVQTHSLSLCVPGLSAHNQFAHLVDFALARPRGFRCVLLVEKTKVVSWGTNVSFDLESGARP